MAYKMHIDWGGCCCEDKCCDKEKKEIEIKPGICIDVDKSVEWEYTINNTMEVEIKSTDGTVNVKHIEWTHDWDCRQVIDLSVDCDDRKVGVCDEDTPWFLEDKIKGISPIYVNPRCSSDGVVEIGIDPAKLTIPDEKVAVSQWCTARYLDDALSIRSAYIESEVDTNNCRLIIKDKETVKPIMKVRLIDTEIQQQEARTWADTDYILLNTGSQTGADVVINSHYDMELSVGEAYWPWIVDGLDGNGFCIIPMDWIYRATFAWTIEVNSWVIAWRTYLYHAWEGSTNVIAMESRQGWGMGELTPGITDTYDPEKYWHPMWYTIGVQTERASLGRYVPRQGFGGSTILRCKKGDKFCLGVKISSTITDPAYNATNPAEFQIQSKTQTWPGGKDEGAYYVLERIAPLP